MTMFLITDDTEGVRLKSYEAAVKGKVSTVRVIVEVTDAYALAHMLESLEKLVDAGKRAAKKSAPEPPRRSRSTVIDHQVLLALPPPSRDGDA